jgi:hypothetical protein
MESLHACLQVILCPHCGNTPHLITRIDVRNWKVTLKHQGCDVWFPLPYEMLAELLNKKPWTVLLEEFCITYRQSLHTVFIDLTERYTENILDLPTYLEKTLYFHSMYVLSPTGTFPVILTQLHNLERLTYNVERFLVLPDTWSNMHALRALTICSIIETIPNSMCTLTQMFHINLDPKNIPLIAGNLMNEWHSFGLRVEYRLHSMIKKNFMNSYWTIALHPYFSDDFIYIANVVMKKIKLPLELWMMIFEHIKRKDVIPTITA